MTNGSQVVVCTDEHNERAYLNLEEWRTYADGYRKFMAAEGIVTTESSTQDKVDLFRKLFQGRQDRYAHGFRRKDGGIGYIPACTNEWGPYCPKCQHRTFECSACQNRKYQPWGDREAYEHLLGAKSNFTGVIGMYVMGADDTVSVLVADFDEKAWKSDSLSYKQAAATRNIDVALERSRSGDGAHAWIFFEEPVPAADARALGFILLNDAMKRNPRLSFSSYDRFFPAQDHIDSSGLGNCIALPLQGAAVKCGNSVFVDDDFAAFPDQWKYLSQIRKVAKQQVAAMISPFRSIDQLIASPSPIRRTISSKAPAAPASDGTDVVIEVTKERGLAIKRTGLSPKAQNDMRKLAVFPNPGLYKAQNARRSVYGISRFVFCGEDNDEQILLPRGCEESLLDYAHKCEAAVKMDDRRNAEQALDVTFSGTLRDAQQRALDRLLGHDCGILCAPTGFGKTVMGAYIIAAIRPRHS